MKRKPKSDFSCYCLNLKLAMKHVKLVDKYLIIIMIVLFVHVTIMLFVYEPGAASPSSIDTVIKSSAASIFGYFISANFIKVENNSSNNDNSENDNLPFSSLVNTGAIAANVPSEADPGSTQMNDLSNQTTVSINLNSTGHSQASVIENKIGFRSKNKQIEDAQDAEPQISSMDYPTQPLERSSAGRLQITIVSLISIFSLILLIVARNIEAIPADSVTVAQLRDFICGGIGFLIGYPTNN